MKLGFSAGWVGLTWQEEFSTSQPKKRRQFSAEQKADVVRRHLVDRVPISDPADELGFALLLCRIIHDYLVDRGELQELVASPAIGFRLAGLAIGVLVGIFVSILFVTTI